MLNITMYYKLIAYYKWLDTMLEVLHPFNMINILLHYITLHYYNDIKQL
jgi:hypothetical protein